jgi:flagellar basal body-associated protein FliL
MATEDDDVNTSFIVTIALLVLAVAFIFYLLVIKKSCGKVTDEHLENQKNKEQQQEDENAEDYMKTEIELEPF